MGCASGPWAGQRTEAELHAGQISVGASNGLNVEANVDEIRGPETIGRCETEGEEEGQMAHEFRIFKQRNRQPEQRGTTRRRRSMVGLYNTNLRQKISLCNIDHFSAVKFTPLDGTSA
uniref:Uncharacterized protein n=1 Tax=Coccidioides posadasii RMSCC 3488 TaxID=454284 RepID=A0A0J6FAE0_COCPO|nr:hypothetical protein CPAG_06328 [Coccidioides posadasii RMSCC 3488]